MNVLLSDLNTAGEAWHAFLADPCAFLERAGYKIDDDARLALEKEIRAMGTLPPYVAGWPISRIPRGIRQDTYAVLLRQQQIFEASGRHQSPGSPD
jgi:hypothetical protein